MTQLQSTTPQRPPQIPPGLARHFEPATYTVRRQVFRLLGGGFHIYDPQGKLAFFSELKAFRLKEDIRIFTDEAKSVEVLRIKARNVIDFSASYDVFDSTTGKILGALRRKGLKSMFRDHWLILNTSEQVVGNIEEDSMFNAIVRRFLDLSWLFPQTFRGSIGNELVCMFKQNFNPFVFKVTLDFSMDTKRLFDRRLAIAAAILLCAVEGRQS